MSIYGKGLVISILPSLEHHRSKHDQSDHKNDKNLEHLNLRRFDASYRIEKVLALAAAINMGSYYNSDIVKQCPDVLSTPRQLLKFVLRVTGRVSLLRILVLAILRATIRIVPAGRIRDTLVGPVTSYLLPSGYRTVIRMPGPTLLNGGPLDIVTRMILYFGSSPGGCWEPRTLSLAVAIGHRSGDIIVAGAHVGVLAVPLAQAVASAGARVHALEPAKIMYDELLRNVALNGTSNLVAERLAVADSTGAGKLYLQGVRSSLICPTKGSTDDSEEIGVISIDDYVGRTGTNVVSLLVLDVEGAELAALKGAENLLSHVESPDVIFEIIPQGGSIESAPADYLQTLGYTVFFIDDDYDLELRLSGKTPVTLRPIMLAPASGRYFNALATRRPERLGALGVVNVSEP